MKREHEFQLIVLQLLWLIFLYTAGKRPTNQIYNAWQACIDFGDRYGNQGEGAKNYRREVTFWWHD